jgi:ABC-type sugar transport system, periplasmic component
MKKLLLCLLIGLCFVAFCFAQGGAEQNKKEVTLKYWAAPLSNTEYTTQFWNEIIAGFTAETGVKVEVEVVPWGDMTKKATTAVTGGDGPDLMGCGNNMSVQLAPTGALLPLNSERMSQIVDNPSDFFDAVVGLEGQDPVTIPINVGSSIMVYNTKAFESVGLAAIPNDWETFIDACQKLTKDTDGDGKINQYGLGMFGKPTQSFKTFFNRYVQFGGELLDKDGVPGFKSQAGYDTLEFIGDMIGKYGIAPAVCAEWTQDEMINAFINGMVMSIVIDPESYTTLENSSLKGEYAFCEMPYILPGETEGIRCTSHVGGTNIGVFSTTKHEKECLQFLNYISRPEINRKISEGFNVIASVRSVYEGVDLSQFLATEVSIMNNASTRMPMVPYFLPSINDASSAVQEVMFAAASGKMTEEFINGQLDILDAKVRENKRLSGY